MGKKTYPVGLMFLRERYNTIPESEVLGNNGIDLMLGVWIHKMQNSCLIYVAYFTWHSGVIYYTVTWWAPYKKQELLTLCESMGSGLLIFLVFCIVFFFLC